MNGALFVVLCFVLCCLVESGTFALSSIELYCIVCVLCCVVFCCVAVGLRKDVEFELRLVEFSVVCFVLCFDTLTLCLDVLRCSDLIGLT